MNEDKTYIAYKNPNMRLAVLLHNAICYMLDDLCKNDDYSVEEMINIVCDYLGSSEKELREFGVLDLFGK